MKQPKGKRIGRALRRQHREQRQRNWAGEPLELSKAKRQAHAEAGLQFNPLLRNIRAEGRASNQRVQDIGNWYGQLGQTMAQGEQQSAASSAAANAAMQKQLETSQAGDLANQAAIAGQNAEFAKLTGANPTAFAPSVQQAAAAAGQRAAAQNTLAMPIIASGVSQAGFLAAQKGNAARDSIYQRLQERKRGAKIRQDLRATQREKGGAQVEALGKLREGERNYRVQQEAFGQGKKEFSAGQKTARQEALQKQREAELDQANKERELGIDEAELGNETFKTHHPGAGKGGLTPTQRRTRKEAHESATAATWRTVKANGIPKTPQEWAGLEAIVAKEDGVSAAEARAAVARIRQKLEKQQRHERQIGAVKKAVSGF